jgi:NADH-quinone oxidoreductase subunit N
MLGMENWAAATPEIFLAVAAMLLLMVGAYRGERATNLIGWLGVIALAITLVLVLRSPGGEAYGGLFTVSAFTRMMKLLVLLGGGIAIVMSRDWLAREQVWRFEYTVLVLLAVLGMLLMISANDLMALYIGLELQSLALYVVAAFQRDSVRSTEAGVKYFVLGAVASGMLLYGASLVYGFVGSTGFGAIAQALTGGTPGLGAVVGMVFVVAGLAFKVAAVPFHMWTPDVYEGAPTPVTSLFAVAPKIAAVSLFVVVMVGPFKPLLQQWQQIVIVLAVASMAWGAFAAIGQENIKRLMAYSSINNIGFVLLALAAGTADSLRAIVIYMTTYLFMNVGVFACILAMKRKNLMLESISDLSGLSRHQPMMAVAMLVFMASLAGVPPLAGFFAKLYIFQAAIGAELYVASVLGVLSSAVAAYYYLRIIKVMYFDQPVEAFDLPVARDLGVVMTVGALFTMFFLFFQGPIIGAADAAASSLLAR